MTTLCVSIDQATAAQDETCPRTNRLNSCVFPVCPEISSIEAGSALHVTHRCMNVCKWVMENSPFIIYACDVVCKRECDDSCQFESVNGFVSAATSVSGFNNFSLHCDSFWSEKKCCSLKG